MKIVLQKIQANVAETIFESRLKKHKKLFIMQQSNFKNTIHKMGKQNLTLFVQALSSFKKKEDKAKFN